MRVFAYSLTGPQPHLVWSNVDAWLISGPVLTLWRGKTPELISLPPEVIGLHDDTPPQPVPAGKYDPPKKREEAIDGSGQAERDAPERRYGRQRARHA